MLLVLRGGEPARGRWSLPGGSVEFGETPREAVVREVREETGLVVAPVELLAVLDAILPAGRPRHHFVLIVFRARARRGRLRAGSDAVKARWVRPADVGVLDVTDSTRRILAMAGP